MATVPSWPALLPPPMIDGYSEKAKPTFIRTEMDSGRARNRRRAVTGAVQFEQTYRLTQTQLAVFEDWWENVVFGGAADALMPIYGGQGKRMVQCSFSDTPSKARVPDSKIWEVSLTMETYVKLVGNG